MSQRSLINISAVVWYAGGIVLLLKGGSLILQAHRIDPQSTWSYVAVVLGLSIGWVKGRLLFHKNCTRNIHRISGLAQPRLWQFFKPGMLVFLGLIIPTGIFLSHAAQGNFSLLCIVGALDLSIACALLVSSSAYWSQSGTINRDP